MMARQSIKSVEGSHSRHVSVEDAESQPIVEKWDALPTDSSPSCGIAPQEPYAHMADIAMLALHIKESLAPLKQADFIKSTFAIVLRLYARTSIELGGSTAKLGIKAQKRTRGLSTRHKPLRR